MNTPPDFSALAQAFARQHAEFAHLKALLAGLDGDQAIDVPLDPLLEIAELTDPMPVPQSPPPAGLRA